MANIHKYTSYYNEIDSSFKTVFYCVCLLVLETVYIKFYKKGKYEKCLNLFCSEKLPARKTASQNKLFTE